MESDASDFAMVASVVRPLPALGHYKTNNMTKPEIKAAERVTQHKDNDS